VSMERLPSDLMLTEYREHATPDRDAYPNLRTNCRALSNFGSSPIRWRRALREAPRERNEANLLGPAGSPGCNPPAGTNPFLRSRVIGRHVLKPFHSIGLRTCSGPSSDLPHGPWARNEANFVSQSNPTTATDRTQSRPGSGRRLGLPARPSGLESPACQA
jgi:hypothetical protein